MFKNKINGTIHGKPGRNSHYQVKRENEPVGSYVRNVLLSESNCLNVFKHGKSDLDYVRYQLQKGGLRLREGSLTFFIICYLRYLQCKKQLKDSFNTACIYQFIIDEDFMDEDEFDRTSLNHSLNKLVAIGFLDRIGKHHNTSGNINYKISDGVWNRTKQPLEWFFSSGNLIGNGGVFKYIPGMKPPGLIEELNEDLWMIIDKQIN
jgi:hypothetical protein